MQIFLRTLLAIYLGHLAADFVFQTRRLVEAKLRGRLSAYLLHGLIHYLSAILLVGFFIPGSIAALSAPGDRRAHAGPFADRFYKSAACSQTGDPWRRRILHCRSTGSFAECGSCRRAALAGDVLQGAHRPAASIPKPGEQIPRRAGDLPRSDLRRRLSDSLPDTFPDGKRQVGRVPESRGAIAKCGVVHRLARTILDSHRTAPAISCGCGADSRRENHHPLSRIQIRAFCRIRSDWYAAERLAGVRGRCFSRRESAPQPQEIA